MRAFFANLLAAFDRALFAPGSAEALALYRIAFFGLTSPLLMYFFFTPIDGFPPELYHAKVLGGVPGILRFDDSISLIWVTGIFGLFSAAGFLSVFSKAAYAYLTLCLYGKPAQYGLPIELMTGTVICNAIMVFARDSDAYSADAWLRRKLGRPARLTPRELYAWPIRFIRAIFVFHAFSAGCFKLAHTGLRWGTQDALYAVLMRSTYLKYPVVVGPPNFLTGYFLDHPRLSQVGSLFTLVVELATPLVFFSRPARVVLIPCMIAMLALTELTIAFPFILSMACEYCAWLPWERIAARSRALRPQGTYSSAPSR